MKGLGFKGSGFRVEVVPSCGLLSPMQAVVVDHALLSLEVVATCC